MLLRVTSLSPRVGCLAKTEAIRHVHACAWYVQVYTTTVHTSHMHPHTHTARPFVLQQLDVEPVMVGVIIFYMWFAEVPCNMSVDVRSLSSRHFYWSQKSPTITMVQAFPLVIVNRRYCHCSFWFVRPSTAPPALV